MESVPPPEPAPRVTSVDAVRGLVMVLMALDHVRYYFTDARFPPEDMARTDLALFLTRWVTHFCAPAFFFLAGVSASLSRGRDRPTPLLSAYLARRGVWLIALELTVVGFAWSFVPGSSFAGVIWALGWSMLALAALVWLPVPWIAALGVGTIALHNLLDGVGWRGLWTFVHGVGPVSLPWLGVEYLVLYALVPWIAVMATGYAVGGVFAWPAAARRRALVWTGVAITAAFLVLRVTNLYGEPAVPSIPGAQGPFAPQPSAAMTVVALLNVEKYPASLLYLLMTLGPTLVLLGAWEALPVGRAGRFLTTFGRVPMLYYVLHLYLIHGLALAVGERTGLAGVYALTALVVLALYVPCRAFAELKARRRSWWSTYL